jgi:host factor-I protein
MKETIEPLLPGETREAFSNRKLIRPSLNRGENHGNHTPAPMPNMERRERPERHDRGDRTERPTGGQGPGKRSAPAEQTHAENFYYLKQMQSRTPMVIVLQDGEEIHGIIEWYDRNCIKVNRDGGEPNVMIYKPAIKYMYKESEGI